MLSLLIKAQISTDEKPYTWENSVPVLKSGIPIVSLPRLDMNTIMAEDKQDEANGYPPRFGYLHKASITIQNSGVWQQSSDGTRIWSLQISSPDALSLNLLYDKFWLPVGAKLFIYSNDKKNVIGAFTSENNKGTQGNPAGFATGLVYGKDITLEYVEPKGISGGVISIANIVIGYRYIRLPDNTQEAFGGSGNCQVNINCSEGSNWQKEKNAVALILVNGNRYCTGSLVNNTKKNNEAYFLTADHCLGGWANASKHDAINNSNLDHWSFYWNYESPSCSNTSSQPIIRSTSGATVISNNSVSDFALLKLKEDPAKLQGATLYYLGWDCTTNIPSSVVGIHHPAGDVKKIATRNGSPGSYNSSFWGFYWSATANGYSVTEGGSSGSPLINNSRRVIGQLYGGSSVNCSNPSQDNAIYGRLSVSWTGNNNSDQRRRLKDWLDPLNTIPASGGILDGMGIGTSGCVNVFENQTVSGSRNIEGCSDLTIRNVVVNSNSSLTISANSTTIQPPFTVNSGSILEIKGK